MARFCKHLVYLFNGFVIVTGAVAGSAAAISAIYWIGRGINKILGLESTAFDEWVATGGTFALIMLFVLMYAVGRNHAERKERRALQQRVFSHHSSQTIGPKE